MSTDKQALPELPAIDPAQALGYDAIRYVAGYPESFVRRYATEYAQAAIAELDAEIARLKLLADRYLWLRDGPDEWGMFRDRWLTKHGIYGDGPADMDRVIDAEIAKGAST